MTLLYCGIMTDKHESGRMGLKSGKFNTRVRGPD